jgi:hypothetical protein
MMAAQLEVQPGRELELTLTAEDPALFEGEVELVLTVATLRQLCQAVTRSERPFMPLLHCTD